MITASLCALRAEFLETRIAPTGRLSGRRLGRALEYMHAHLMESVRLEDIAAAAGLSPFHFARLFRSTTGFTPHRYLMLARVERAKAMLLRCDRTMTEIATEVGFSDQSHMSKVFRRLMGSSPARFRASVALSHLPLQPVRQPAAAALDKVPAQANT